MFLQNIKQACDIYGKIRKIIIIGGTEVPGRSYPIFSHCYPSYIFL
jgi:hypothetical protein